VKFSREKPKKTKTGATPKTASAQVEAVVDASLAEAAPERDLTEELSDRNVRIIGPEFLQQGNDKLINFDTEKQHTDAGLKTEKSIE
jgi:hypothetical protein